MTLTAYTDGACRESNPGSCSCSYVVFKDDKEIHRHGFYLGDNFTNNYAEYIALLSVLEWAYNNSIKEMVIFSDSKLVVNQVNGEWKVNEPGLKSVRDRSYGLLIHGKHTLRHIRGHMGIPGNEAADRLCNEILDDIQKGRDGTEIFGTNKEHASGK